MKKKTSFQTILGILSPESMRLSWTIVANTAGKISQDWGYGLGWAILPEQHECGCCKDQEKAIAHTGKSQCTF